MYLLDTNTCIGVLHTKIPGLVERLQSHDPAEVCLCSMVKAELLYGARHSERIVDNLQLLAEFFAPYRSLPFDDLCAEHYGMIRAELASAGMPIGANDLVIAATARAHDAILVTHNTGEFSRVPGLKVEDWQAEPPAANGRQHDDED